MKQFEMDHLFFPEEKPIKFDETNKPSWLLQDNSWIWKYHILTLKVGETFKTDFRGIKRIK